MNETGLSERDGRVVREDGAWAVRAGRGERDGPCIQNYTGGGIAATLDASYYKGPGARNGKEREFVAVSIGNGQANQIGMGERANTLDCMHDQQAVVTDGKPPRKYIVRRLTPLECVRLQGYPDWWFDGTEGSDSAKYKACGNSLAIPCAYDVMNRIARFVENEKEDI